MHHLSRRLVSGVANHPNKRYLQAYYEAGATFERGEGRKALRMMLDAIKMEPKDPDGLMLLGVMLNAENLGDEARGVFEKAVADFPDLAWVHHCWAMFLHQHENYDAARRIMAHAMSLDPNEAAHHINYAVILQYCGFMSESETELRNALTKFPDDHRIENALSINLVEQKRFDEALEYGQRAVKADEKNASARGNLSVAYFNMGMFQESEHWSTKALDIVQGLGADLSENSWIFIRGQARLAQQKFQSGWNDYKKKRIDVAYENKFQWNAHLNNIAQKEINGSNVLVFGEQGLGDEILFNGILNAIAEDVQQLTYVCNSRLVELTQRAFPHIKVKKYTTEVNRRMHRISMQEDDFAALNPDVAVLIGDLLPSYIRSIEDFEGRHARLAADPARIDHWRSKLRELSDRPKIGVCWRSSLNTGQRAKYYAPFKKWCEVLRAYDIDVINLQYDDCTAELVAARNTYGLDIINYGGTELDLKMDLDENAALCSALDLVVSAPTAGGTIAAAVGTPTWFLCAAEPWTAFGVKDRLPFFGKNTWCFWSQAYADWDEVFARLDKELNAMFPGARRS